MNVHESVGDFLKSLLPPPPRVYNLAGSSAALYLAAMPGPFLAVEAGEEAASALWKDILFYRRYLGLDASGVRFLPSRDGPGTAGERAEVAYSLAGDVLSISVVASANAIEEPLWGRDGLDAQALRIGPGDELDREESERRLIALGYRSMPLVTEKGQYSLRGFILDIYPSTALTPYRVEFFGDEVEEVRDFDVDSQRSRGEAEGFAVLPAREPESGPLPAGLFRGTVCYFSDALRPHAPHGTLHGPPGGAVVLSRFGIAGEGVDAGLLPLDGLGLLHTERQDIYGLSGALKALAPSFRMALVASSRGQAERLREVLSERAEGAEGGLVCPEINLDSLGSYQGRLSVTVAELSAGLYLSGKPGKPGMIILTEKELFGDRPAYRPLRKSRVSTLLENIDDLGAGDFVVHKDRGIGKFEGLVHQEVEGYEYDLLALEYAGGDRLYLPLHAIERVRKFHAEEGVVPRLDELGTKRWQRTRQRVQGKIREMAKKLLGIYAERSVAPGHAFSPDAEMHREFDSFFPYEETPDQAAAIAEIKKDMESGRPMDRLLCGDVGYGKTEVAMRAAFKAVYDGKQVAVLVPTTLLCEQHLRVFRSRFAAFPVSIEGLSRFRSRRERLDALERLRRGGVDIIIATHALLRAGAAFANLGLLVIDEEHRFGVKDKERMKELKRGLDVLGMSATPIPRTLQMSLSGIRSMSVIETPPEERLAVKSTVAAFDRALVRETVEKELERGGQVFFVHNRIKDIGRVERMLGELLPGARVAVAHGRMPERDLEKVMLSFLDREVDVLLCTAIIGSGLDIPTANTIVINMAERMGLADLYQLKGRVGRSSAKAYAYYLTPGEAAVTEDAKKRLQAVQDMSYMGAGLRLAMKDLEIRGAGNLLGPEQSGCIHAVGFDLYMEMLEQAVAELKGVKLREKVRPAVVLRLNAFIPEEYVGDMALRLGLYRSIASAETEEELGRLESEMSDRFGRPPEAFLNLLKIRRVGILAEGLSVSEVRGMDGSARFTVAPESPLTAEDILGAFESRVRFFEGGFELAVEHEPCGEVEGALRALRRTSGGERVADGKT